MKIAFFTNHIAGMPRKATVLLLAEAYHNSGHEVRIVTTGYSLVSILLRDPRHAYAKACPLNQWFSVDLRMKGYVPRPWINPGRFPLAILNSLTVPFFKRYSSRIAGPVISELQDADIIFIESDASLLYVPNIKKYFPKARLIYQASDSLVTLNVHPVIMKAEKKYMPLFDMVICMAEVRLKEFNHPNVHYIPQAVDTAIFDTPVANPYPAKHNIISVGDMLFDAQAVMALAKACPDWTIHLFGEKARCPQPFSNIITHGEVPLQATIPYIVHADIGMAPYRPVPDAGYLSQSSLKMRQYTYARLPIIAPDFATANYAHAIPYNPHDLSTIREAVQKASRYNRSAISREGIVSWDQVARQILDAL